MLRRITKKAKNEPGEFSSDRFGPIDYSDLENLQR